MSAFTLYPMKPITVGNHTITSWSQECDMIEVTRSTGHWIVDPDWTFKDYRGHVHAYGTEDDPTPTLQRFTRWETYLDDGYLEERYIDWYQCKQCHQVLEPTLKYIAPPMHREFMPGLITTTVGVVSTVPPETFEAQVHDKDYTIHPGGSWSYSQYLYEWTGYAQPTTTPASAQRVD